MSNKVYDAIIESLKRNGKIPQDATYEFIDKLSEEHIGKHVVFRAKITGVAIKLSPKIQAFSTDEDGSKIDVLDGLNTKFLDNNVKFSREYLINYSEHDPQWSLIEHRDFFNREDFD